MYKRQRLNNYISSTGLCSRREADKLIEQGRVTVNGKKAQVGQTVEEGAMVKVNNKLIKPKDVYKRQCYSFSWFKSKQWF